MGKHQTTDLDRARDELFSHINRCDVLQATEEQKQEWLEDTIGYMADRYPMLSVRQIAELQTLAERFCEPAIPHGKKHTALNADEWQDTEAEMETEVAATA